ncbi:MAG: hypothetical protein EPN85_04460 [Bacteroidetes bacterium]|nr:MAG: hypothetical protein EPN85_04460 [Bacteroidota bacterium]
MGAGVCLSLNTPFSPTMDNNELQKTVTNLSNYYCPENNNKNQFKEEYRFLINKKSTPPSLITHPEYRFLCWLNHNNSENFPISINKLLIPKITNFSYFEFKKSYVTNEIRISLFNLLCEFVKDRNAVFNLENVDLLIGGSFIDPNNESPNDLDFILLLPNNYIVSYPAACDEEDERIMQIKIDAHFLPIDYSFRSIKAYIHIMMLGNKPEIKDKQYELENNNFETRGIIKVRFPLLRSHEVIPVRK